MNDDTCQRAGHEYEPADNCRACAAERLADTEADTAPQRPVPAPAALVEVAEHHRRAQPAPSRARREFAQPGELLPVDGFDVASCKRAGPTCGVFVDTPDGRAAHKMVFGHEPE